MDSSILERNTAQEPVPRGTGEAERHDGTKTIKLALQGGGAHGAFTWACSTGCSRRSASPFEGISATGAGAMDATVAAFGLRQGGGRQALANFWRRVSHSADFSLLQPSWTDKPMGNRHLESSSPTGSSWSSSRKSAGPRRRAG